MAISRILRPVATSSESDGDFSVHVPVLLHLDSLNNFFDGERVGDRDSEAALRDGSSDLLH